MKTKIRTLLFLFIPLLPGPAFADEPITLERFVNEAQGENLSLKAESASAQAAKEGAVGIALPPPMVGMTQMTDDSGRATNFEISQTVPFPAKLAHDRSARKFEASAREAQLRGREKGVLSQAKLLYFKLWKAQERLNLLQEKRRAIEEHLKLTRAATRSDSFLKIHLIKAESDLDFLQNEVFQADQEHREAQIKAAEFINRDPKSVHLTAAEFPPSTIPREESLQTPFPLQAKRLEIETLKAREAEAKSSWFPEFNLRYREMGGTQMTPRYSEVMVGASLPFIFFWEPKSASAKASAERAQGEYLLSQEKRRIDSERALLFARADSLRKQLDQFKDKLLPSAEKRMRIVHNLAPRDMETLQDHREAMEAFPELKLKALGIREQYEETIAELEKFASGDMK